MRTMATFVRSATLAILGAATASQAAQFSVAGDTGDYDIKQNSAGVPVLESTTAQTITTGARISNRGYNAIFIFALPVLPSGEGVTSAHFVASSSSNFLGVSGGLYYSLSDYPFDIDLWGIGFQTTTNPLIEYLEADSDTDPANVKIQDSILRTNGDTYANNQKADTSAAGDAALASYLQSFYVANPGYTGGSYVFLRLNPDNNPDDTITSDGSFGYSGYIMATANHGTASMRPALTIETGVIPEPVTAALLAMGGGLLACVRRRSWAD